MSRVDTTIADLWHAANGLCGLCGQPTPLEDATRDHVIPKSMGGSWARRNLRMACRDCNVARGNAFPAGRFRHLTESQQRYIWQRDSGACAQCGYRQALVFHEHKMRRGGNRGRLMCMSCLLGRPDDTRSPQALPNVAETEPRQGEKP